jgi:hypothetical protein
VDRIGQKHPVKAFNLLLADSVELRIQEVLEEKLAIILLSMSSAWTRPRMCWILRKATRCLRSCTPRRFSTPMTWRTRSTEALHAVREQAQQAIAGRSYYSETVLDPTLAQQLSRHPLPHWLERMTTAYLRSAGSQVRRDLFSDRATSREAA